MTIISHNFEPKGLVFSRATAVAMADLRWMRMSTYIRMGLPTKRACHTKALTIRYGQKSQIMNECVERVTALERANSFNQNYLSIFLNMVVC